MKEDESLKRILYSWPAEFDNGKALELGFVRDTGFDQIVRDYVDSLGLINGSANESVSGEKGGRRDGGRNDGAAGRMRSRGVNPTRQLHGKEIREGRYVKRSTKKIQ